VECINQILYKLSVPLYHHSRAYFRACCILLYITCCLKKCHGRFHNCKDGLNMSEDKLPVLVLVGKEMECVGVDWILLAGDTDKCWALMKTAMKI
jgi:hypothetical protein